MANFEEQLAAETEHDQWLKQQNRLLERKKVEKQLAAQGVSFKPQQFEALKRPITQQLTAYSAEQGVLVSFDFVMGLLSSAKHCRLTTSLLLAAQLQPETVCKRIRIDHREFSIFFCHQSTFDRKGFRRGSTPFAEN